jgi:hypothetical protein
MEKEVNKILERLSMQVISLDEARAEMRILGLFGVSTRLFGVYDRIGYIQSIWKSPYNAFEEATLLNKRLETDEYFIDWVIVG